METTFIDSSSLGVLIGAHRRLKSRGGRLLVACDNEAILKTFRVTGLDGVFGLAPSVDERARPEPDGRVDRLAAWSGAGGPSAGEPASRGRPGGPRRATGASTSSSRESCVARTSWRSCGSKIAANPAAPRTGAASAPTSTSPSTTTRWARSCTSWSCSASPAGRWMTIVRDSPRDECRICGLCGCTSSVRRSQ